MPEQRRVIEYALARRAILAELARGQRSAAEVCDAHPDLQRAARYYGEAAGDGCPVCRERKLTCVTYAYGDELQHASGRARPSRSLDALAARFEQVQIYVVEVCQACGWNHLRRSFLIGKAAGEGSGLPPLASPRSARRPAGGTGSDLSASAANAGPTGERW